MVQVTEAVIHFIAHVFESLTAGIFHHVHEQVSSARAQEQNDEWLDCFTEDDEIFSEWTSPRRQGYMIINCTETSHTCETPRMINTDEDWRDFRPSFYKTLQRSFLTTIAICTLGILIGIMGVITTYIASQTLDFCAEGITRIPLPWNIMIFICELVSAILFHIWYPTELIFSFDLSVVKASGVFTVCLFALSLDLTYRIVFFAFDFESRSCYLMCPLFVLLCISMLTQALWLSGCLIDRLNEERRNRLHKRLYLTIKLVFPFISGWIICFILVWSVYPWFVSERRNSLTRMGIATFSPLIGSLAKTISRVLVQRLWYLNHPGKSFALLSCIYGGSAIFFRVMQADFSSLETVALLAGISGVVEVLERSSIVLRDHFDNQVLEWRVVRLGDFRTPRSERLTADVAVMSMVYEMAAIITVNGYILIYKLVFTNAHTFDVVQRFIKFVVVQCAIESFFITISLFISSHYQNMAVLSVWRKKCLKYCLIATFNLTLITMFGGGFITETLMHDDEFIPPNCTKGPFN